jgi:hypothetical protein
MMAKKNAKKCPNWKKNEEEAIRIVESDIA